VSADPTPSDLRAARAALLARGDLTGAALRSALTDVTDQWLAALLGEEPDVALVAVGGYGRREPAPGSDLDLVLVHRGRGDVKQVADRIWYPIWDTGVPLDHSVRTVSEAVAVAREDLKAALGLLDARHVAGDAALTADLRAAALAAWRTSAHKRLPELRESAVERAQKFGEAAFLLEPDIKDSRGGLRDLQAVRAAAAAWLADPPGERLRAAHTVLLDVRGELHRRTGRANDRLVLQEQGPVAQALGLSDADALMTTVYDAARAVAFAVDLMWRAVEGALRPTRRWSRGRTGQRRPLAQGVLEHDGEAVLAPDADPAGDPLLVVRIAVAAAEAGVVVAPHTLDRLAAEAAPLPDPWPRAAVDGLVSLFGAGPAAIPVVEALDQAGLFVRLIPEWGNVRCRPQRNPVHRFTVDRHLVEAAVECGALARRVSRPDLLVLAGLLHDLGKGWPGDHTEAGVKVVPVVARRMGLPEPDVATLTALIRHHLLLPETATRRDLTDPASIRLVADAVGDRGTLELLHALTEADAKATGPAAWNDWKAGLVADLVRRVSAVLAGEPPPAPQPLTEAQRALAEGAGTLAVAVEDSTVTVAAPDRPGLLWRAAGVLSLHRLEIRSATATSVGATAVTVFDVSPRFGSPPDWNLVRDDLRHALDQPEALEARLAERERAYAPSQAPPPYLLWVDDASQVASVLELRAHDRLGLLYRATRALTGCGLDVRAARISTLGAEVVDAFYVSEQDGSLVTSPQRRDEILAAVEVALG
jgi:[protein-PII] uridylyltransferase